MNFRYEGGKKFLSFIICIRVGSPIEWTDLI